MDLPEGFTFHCQASQRFSDEDMQEIVELDENKNPTGLKIVDQIIDPEVESMKIFVIGLAHTNQTE